MAMMDVEGRNGMDGWEYKNLVDLISPGRKLSRGTRLSMFIQQASN
jgi:hypothetical protein